MSVRWVNNSAGLPYEGEPVAFVLDGRDVPLDGTYVDRRFRSRWSGYPIERVRAWRSASFDASVVAVARDAEV
jgi:hypothetical protein